MTDKKRILHIESTIGGKQKLAKVLERDYYLRAVETIDEAMYLLQTQKWDLVVCERTVETPDDGFALAECLKEAGQLVMIFAWKPSGANVPHLAKRASTQKQISQMVERLLSKNQ